jgi:uncharacterized protein (DUF433 family)
MPSARPNGRAADSRFSTPLYSIAEAARFVGVAPSTFCTWAKGYVRKPVGRPQVRGEPIVTAVTANARAPVVPFIGLAESVVVAAFRAAGVSMQHLRRAVGVLQKEIGLEHALASQRLYTDGATVLFDYADREDDAELAGLTVVVSRQRVFAEVVEEYLDRVTYGADGWAARLTSPVTQGRVVEVDPLRAFGRPIFLHGAARVEDVLDRFRAGDSLVGVAEDFGVPVKDVEEVLRVRVPAAAWVLRRPEPRPAGGARGAPGGGLEAEDPRGGLRAS